MSAKFEVGDRVRLTAEGVKYLRLSHQVEDATSDATGCVSEASEGVAAVKFEGISRPQYAEGRDWVMADGEIEPAEVAP